MVVGLSEIMLQIPSASSLKDKRQILRSLIERIRRDFQVSIAEVEDHDLWGNATLGIAAVSNDVGHLESVLAKVRSAIDERPELEIVGQWQEIERR
jgi:uncharacterized protein